LGDEGIIEDERKKETEDNWSKTVKDTVRYIIRAENTTAGRVNLTGIFLVGVCGIIWGGLFSEEGIILVTAFIISAVIAERISSSRAPVRRRRKR
jgi:hypothetical protein